MFSISFLLYVSGESTKLKKIKCIVDTQISTLYTQGLVDFEH